MANLVFTLQEIESEPGGRQGRYDNSLEYQDQTDRQEGQLSIKFESNEKIISAPDTLYFTTSSGRRPARSSRTSYQRR